MLMTDIHMDRPKDWRKNQPYMQTVKQTQTHTDRQTDRKTVGNENLVEDKIIITSFFFCLSTVSCLFVPTTVFLSVAPTNKHGPPWASSWSNERGMTKNIAQVQLLRVAAVLCLLSIKLKKMKHR